MYMAVTLEKITPGEKHAFMKNMVTYSAFRAKGMMSTVPGAANSFTCWVFQLLTTRHKSGQANLCLLKQYLVVS